MNKKDIWSEITSKRSLISLNIKELIDFRDLLGLFVRREIVTYYKPLLTTLVFTVIFGKLAKISTDGLPPILFYLAGVTAWNYFADSFRNTSDTFKKNEQIFGKVYFPRVIMPLSTVISGLLKFGIQMLLLLGFIVYFKIAGSNIVFSWDVFWVVPILLFLMAFLGLGCGMIISSLTTKYRDLTFLIQFGIQLLMYATPVIYPLSQIPDKWKWLVEMNPLTSIVESFRFIFLGQGQFYYSSLLYSFVFTIVLFFFSVLIFNRTEKNFIDTV